MSNNFNFDLGNMPPIGWAILIAIIILFIGKMFELSFLFNLGVFMLAFLGIFIIIAFIKMIID